MSSYAKYLDSRIAAFKILKHDVVRVQNESNRRSDGQSGACELLALFGSTPNPDIYELKLTFQAKARRLRHLSVEKGLLREVKAIQRVLDSLVLCKVSLSGYTCH